MGCRLSTLGFGDVVPSDGLHAALRTVDPAAAPSMGCRLSTLGFGAVDLVTCLAIPPRFGRLFGPAPLPLVAADGGSGLGVSTLLEII